MKLALNGALTIGTLDGANIEIREHVGAENVIIFGLTADQVAERLRTGFTGAMAVEGSGGADGAAAVAGSPRLAAVLESLRNGTFSPDDPGRFVPIVESLLGFDRFMVAADFEAYWKAQRAVDALWRSPRDWWRMSILNAARMSWFSSDRAVREYAREVWRVPVG